MDRCVRDSVLAKAGSVARKKAAAAADVSHTLVRRLASALIAGGRSV